MTKLASRARNIAGLECKADCRLMFVKRRPKRSTAKKSTRLPAEIYCFGVSQLPEIATTYQFVSRTVVKIIVGSSTRKFLGHLDGTQDGIFLCASGRPIVINSGNTPRLWIAMSYAY
jgi:hypothetical protein